MENQPNESRFLTGVKSNWRLLSLLFILGLVYGEYRGVIADVATNKRRQDNKIMDIEANEDAIMQIRLDHAFEKGYKTAQNECKENYK